MTDNTESMSTEDRLIKEPLTAKEVAELDHIESIFFAYREFTADADRVLETLGFGRAHHRALFFVNRQPGMTVAELLEILKITKQSLARVLKQLVESGYIAQRTGSEDRRQRLLYPTERGRLLIMELSRPQSRRINHALRKSGIAHTDAIFRFMEGMKTGEIEPTSTTDREAT
jgi:DNA-binding MarR family transcriptional regulator